MKIKDGSITIPDKIRVEYEFGKRITSDYENKIHWLPIDIKKFKIDKPTILCAGGIATTNSKDSNYVAKMIQRIVPIDGEAQILSIIHSHLEGESAARYFDEDPEELFMYGYKEAAEIVDAIFVPQVVDNEGNRLLIQDACKNVRNIIMFAHCYGHFMLVKNIEEAFKDSLRYLSYTPEEADYILKQVFVLSYEAGTSFKTAFSNVNITSIASEIWSDDVLSLVKRDFDKIVMQGDEKQKILSSKMFKSKDPNLVRKALSDNKYLVLKEGNVIDIYTNPLTTDHTDHDLSTIYKHLDGHYSSYTNELGMIVSETISAVLNVVLKTSLDNKYSSSFKPLNINEIFDATCETLKLARTHFGEVAELDIE